MAKENKIRICIKGNGGEFVLGSVKKEVYEYWSNKKSEVFEDYALASDSNNVSDIPEEMNFLSNGWYECDNIEHVDGCMLDSSNIIIELPDGEIQEIKNIREHYWEHDENICEMGEIYSYSGENPSYPEGYYFSAETLEKGILFDLEFVLPRETAFNDLNLVFFYIDLNGSDFLINVGYVMPGNSIESPTMLKNNGGSTNGRDITFKIFGILS